MDGHPSSAAAASTAARSSRSSQTPSPSHSASASASSSAHHHHHHHHKRKFPSSSSSAAAVPPPHPPPPSSNATTATTAFSLSDTGALTSNDDLDSASARDEDSDDDPDDADVDDDDDDDSSIRTFTAARAAADLGASASNSRTAKPAKADENAGKEEKAAAAQGSASVAALAPSSSAPAAMIPGLVLKEDTVKGIFTDNIQTSGAYSTREEGLKREEDAGRLKFLCYANDGVDEHMIWLIGLKNIFARQLPNMPREYIVRLVMDRCHKSMMVIRNNQVVGGITYRPYVKQKFGEIAFCAITADEQVKGYGTRLMNHLKQHARDVDGLTHFLTYADNNAVGYFLKQGFSKEITLDKEIWQGYIKDYDGVILMECKIDPKLPYTNLSTMIRRQRQAIDEKIRELSNCHIVYPGIEFQKKEAGVPRKPIKVEEIPGLREAGWTPDQWGHSRFKNANTDSATIRQSLNNLIRLLLKTMNEHPDAWPFREPVDARDVPDYYDIIKDPMDLRTMSKRLESEQYYITLEMFIGDVKRMCANARTYNSPETIYYKCATRLENYFLSKVTAELSNGGKFNHSARGMHIQ